MCRQSKFSDFDKFVCGCLFLLDRFPPVFARDGRKVIGFDCKLNIFPKQDSFIRHTFPVQYVLENQQLATLFFNLGKLSGTPCTKNKMNQAE